ncbi:MAG: hypothetical protein QHG99_00870 [Methanomicrobiales archaeon]|nr:hypothetical protein [Methanomicrobiales archaeon]
MAHDEFMPGQGEERPADGTCFGDPVGSTGSRWANDAACPGQMEPNRRSAAFIGLSPERVNPLLEPTFDDFFLMGIG